MITISNNEHFFHLHHGFGDSFALIVAGARSDGVHIAPVGLRLRMNLGITIHLRGGGQQHASRDSLGQTQHVQSSLGTGLDSLDGIVLQAV